jgi:hypothetical protein
VIAAGVTASLSLPVDDVQAGLGRDLQAHIAALLEPFVVLFGEHCRREADQRVSYS